MLCVNMNMFGLLGFFGVVFREISIKDDAKSQT